LPPTTQSAMSMHLLAIAQEGGLAILYGNIALNGCVVKTAGVDESISCVRGLSSRDRIPRRNRSKHFGRQGCSKRFIDAGIMFFT
jgi:hypothetical protein